MEERPNRSHGESGRPTENGVAGNTWKGPSIAGDMIRRMNDQHREVIAALDALVASGHYYRKHERQGER